MVPAVKAHNRYKTGCRSRQSCRGICFTYWNRYNNNWQLKFVFDGIIYYCRRLRSLSCFRKYGRISGPVTSPFQPVISTTIRLLSWYMVVAFQLNRSETRFSTHTYITPENWNLNHVRRNDQGVLTLRNIILNWDLVSR